MRKLLNEVGFTILETLMSLIIFMVIISITTSSLNSFLNRNQIQGTLNRLEWDNFINEVQKEVNTSIDQKVYNDMLIIEDSLQVTSSYRKYATIVRRQKLGTGHEIVLQNVSNIYFEKSGRYQISIKVVDLTGGVYEKNIRVLIH